MTIASYLSIYHSEPMIIASYVLYHSEPITIASYLLYHSEPICYITVNL